MKLAFMGLGRMGQGMASRLVASGCDVTVYNRSADKTAPLKALGAQVAQTPAEAAAGADIVFTILANDNSLETVMGKETVNAMAPGGIHISMGTVGTKLAAAMAAAHDAMGRVYLSCPVFGRPDAAAAGQLRLCLAGPAGARQTVKPVLSLLGELWEFGDDPVSAHAVKLAGNFMIAVSIEMMGEAFALLEKSNASPEKFFELISSTIFACPIIKNYGRMVLNGSFDTAGFTANLGAKDVTLVRDAARLTETPMPLAAVLEDRFLRILARGWGEKDWTVVGRAPRDDAGLK